MLDNDTQLIAESFPQLSGYGRPPNPSKVPPNPTCDKTHLLLIHYYYIYVLSTKGSSFKLCWLHEFGQNHQTLKNAGENPAAVGIYFYSNLVRKYL